MQGRANGFRKAKRALLFEMCYRRPSPHPSRGFGLHPFSHSETRKPILGSARTAREEDASNLPAAPLFDSELALHPSRRGRRGRRRRALALINYLRHSGVELPSAIWLRYGRELRRRRAGERRREEEKRKEETRAQGRQEKSRSRGTPPPSLGCHSETGRGAKRRGGFATAPPGGRDFLPLSSTPSRFGLWRKRKWSLR